MKRPILLLGSLLAGVLLCGCNRKPDATSAAESAAPAAGKAPAAATSEPPFAGGPKTSFQEVTSQLDPGGSLYVYLATDQWLAGLSKKVLDLRGFLMSVAHPAPDEREMIDRGFNLAGSLIQRSGLEELTGVGLSAAPVAPGLFRNKFILHHASGAGQGFLWSLFGREPHALAAQNLLPATTALAAFGDLDVVQLLKVIESELAQSGIPPVVEAVRAFPQMFEKETQLSWAKLVGSLGSEAGVIVTLDASKQLTVPLGGAAGEIEIPTPGLILALQVKDDTLFDHLSGKLKENPGTTTTAEAGLKMCAMPMPNPLQIPLQITVASSGDYLFLASDPALVRTVQQVRSGKQPGLKKAAEFQELARHVPAQGNQFVYVSKSFGDAFAEFQKQAMGQSGLSPQELAKIQKLFGTGLPTYSLAIGAHTANGWQTTSVGNQDSAGAALVLPAVAGTAVLAGMLLPALAKAKGRAQTINSVSNLKQLGLAARMFANDHGDKYPPAATWCDAILDNVTSPKPFKASNDSTPGRCSFAYNAKLGGMAEDKVRPDTVMFFEAESGWNTSGGIELLLPRPRQPGTYVIGFADGSVQQVPVARVRTLRWDP